MRRFSWHNSLPCRWLLDPFTPFHRGGVIRLCTTLCRGLRPKFIGLSRGWPFFSLLAQLLYFRKTQLVLFTNLKTRGRRVRIFIREQDLVSLGWHSCSLLLAHFLGVRRRKFFLFTNIRKRWGRNLRVEFIRERKRKLPQFTDTVPDRVTHRHDRKARLPQQNPVRHTRLRFEDSEGDRRRERKQLPHVHHPTLASGIGRIRVEAPHHFHQSDNGGMLPRVVEEAQVALTHAAQVLLRLRVADPIPVRNATVGRLVCPSPLPRLRLQQPVRAAHVQLNDVAHSLKPKQSSQYFKNKTLEKRRENKTTTYPNPKP